MWIRFQPHVAILGPVGRGARAGAKAGPGALGCQCIAWQLRLALQPFRAAVVLRVVLHALCLFVVPPNRLPGRAQLGCMFGLIG